MSAYTDRIALRREARAFAEIVKRAFKRPEAKRWHALHYGNMSKRWDDGPCLQAAMAIACADGHRGEIMEVARGHHAVYVLEGIWIDGHGELLPRRTLNGVEKAKPLGHNFKTLKRKKACSWRWAPPRAPFLLVRAIRKEMWAQKRRS